MRAFNLAIGLGALAQGATQLLAALGRIEPDFWPFIQVRNRGARLAASGLAFLIGAALIGSSFAG